jgi:hypothetical protein
MGAMVSRPASKRPQGAPGFARQIWREPTGLGSARAFAPQAKRSAGSSLRVPETVQEGWRSPGSPLQPDLRAWLEPRFGDLGHVRVHTDGEAETAAEAAGAAAFTWKNHVVFGWHRYQPETPAGQALLAHEVVHIVQQRGRARPRATRSFQATTIRWSKMHGTCWPEARHRRPLRRRWCSRRAWMRRRP